MRMNNLTQIMIPFRARGPEVTRHSGGVLVNFHTPKGDWIRCELAGTWLARVLAPQFRQQDQNNRLLRRQRVRPVKRNVGWEGLVLS